MDTNTHYYIGTGDKYFCSQGCKFSWLSVNMENIEQGRPIEFIRHRRESGGYEKGTEHEGWNKLIAECQLKGLTIGPN